MIPTVIVSQFMGNIGEHHLDPPIEEKLDSGAPQGLQ